MRHENSSILELDGKEVSEFTPSKPREKWLRKRTHVKIRVGVKSQPNSVPLDFLILCTPGILPVCEFYLFSFFPLMLLDLFLQNVTANHRVNDAVFTEDSQQIVTGRFMYGPLDMVTLAGEKVNTLNTARSWEHLRFIYVCAHF